MPAIAMCTSLVIWYIVGGHPAGVIVFIFLFIFIEFYFVMKFPRFTVVAIISIVTQGKLKTRCLNYIWLTFPSLDHWIRAGSEEAWQNSKYFLDPASDDFSHSRWPRAMDNHTIPPTYLRLTD